MNTIRETQSVDHAAKPTEPSLKTLDSIPSLNNSSVQGGSVSARGHNTTHTSGNDTMVNVTDFAGAITDGNVQRVYQNMILNTSSVMQDDIHDEPKMSNFVGPDMAGSMTERQTKRKGDKMLPQEIKIADMHMKRRAPHLYLSKKVREGGRAGSLNEFNTILKQSLMSPKKTRAIATMHEMEDLERTSLSRRERKAKLTIAQT